MPLEQGYPIRRHETRRQFIKKAGVITAAVAAADLLPFSLRAAAGIPGVSIVLDPADNLTRQAPVQWAAGQLRDALVARAVNATVVSSMEQAPAENLCVFVTGTDSPLVSQSPDKHGLIFSATPESLVLVEGTLSDNRRALLAAGPDERGLVYALLELADRVNHANDPRTALTVKQPVNEHPANAIRSVSRLFTSDVEDNPWYNDKAFWQNYLTMLATNRFNRFNLGFGLGYDFTTGITDCYFHFAYPFLLAVPGYDVRAVPLPDSDRDANLGMLQFISNEAARRGLEFQLGLWTHAYQWTDSPRANYVITGLTPESQGPYCRDALRLLLTQCPNITGVTIRTHGESGVPEGEIEIWKTIFSGVAGCGRTVGIDLHAKGINQSIIDSALATGMPVTISPKFWAEHMGLPYMQGSIRQQEMPPRDKQDNGFFSRSSGSRSFLRYGYGDLFEQDRRYGVLHRIWPGTQRVLLWGDPETAAAYGRVAGFCGSNGVEIFEPLTFKGRKGSGLPDGRNAYAKTALKPVFDFEKYEYTYRVWGRNLYNPDNDGDGWRRCLRSQCGPDVEPAESALSSAGKILPLITTAHCPSAANNNYWPEMYWNMPMTEAQHKNPYSDTPNPKRFGTVSPLDPEFFSSCDEFALELLNETPSGKKSPAWVAARLDEYAEQTQLALFRLKARDNSNAPMRRLRIDATIQVGLGRFFAAKFRAGVFYSLYLNTQNQEWLRDSLEETRAARAIWAGFANFATGIYMDDVTYGPEYFQRGHWSDRLDAMDADVADMELLLIQARSNTPSKGHIKEIQGVIHETSQGKLNWNPGKLSGGFPAPPTSFRRAYELVLTIPAKSLKHFGRVANLELCYRHVNQGEPWQEMEMKREKHEFGATIPVAYTDSPFPLQYYFRLRLKSGGVVLHPGLENLFNGQPYYVVQQT
jgi:hypothetical protein